MYFTQSYPLITGNSISLQFHDSAVMYTTDSVLVLITNVSTIFVRATT